MSTEINISSVKGKVIVITGGGRGLGRTTAEYLQGLGAKVAVCARSEGDLREAAQALASGGKVPFLTKTADVNSEASLRLFFSAAEAELGPLDGLVCAAGIYGDIGPFAESQFHQWVSAIEINLIGAARTIHTCLPYFKKDHHSIVLYSGGGQGPMENFSAYTTSKGGISRLTETLGAELSRKKIFVNAIAPGAVNTKLLEDLLAAGPQKVGQQIFDRSLKQKSQGGTSPLKAAELTAWLLSDRAQGLFGKTLSAVWDDYYNLANLEELSQKDLFQVRRVVDAEGGTRSKT